MVSNWELSDEEIHKQAGRKPRPLLTEEKGEDMAKGTKRGKKPVTKRAAAAKPRPSGRKRATQPVLPGTEEGLPKMSNSLRKLLPQVDEAIHEAATWKQSENDFKGTIQELMAEEGILEVVLPRGGKLKYKPGHPSLTYIAPKKGGVSGEDSENGENEGTGAEDSEE